MLAGEWHLSGTYFEACNCEPICPCRRVGQRLGGRSSFGVCFGTLSWRIQDGGFEDIDLSGRSVALSLRFFDDEPGTPWTVILYIDREATQQQRDALARIFLGQAGGTPPQNYANFIADVVAIRAADIALDHTAGRQEILISNVTEARTAENFVADEPVSCGIPGFENPGQEVRAEVLRSDDPPLVWDVRGRCGFATVFHYTS